MLYFNKSGGGWGNTRDESFYAGFGGANPSPLFEGQCIVGESGLPLVASRIHRKGEPTYLGWRAAEVKCGHALDGGLQQLVSSLAKRSRIETVLVHPAILSSSDVMGALKTALPAYSFVNLSTAFPKDGQVVIKPLGASDEVVELIPAAPTLTRLHYMLAEAV
jgi:hypothetical protein